MVAGGFAALLVVRVLTVVNDNVLRWLAIGLGKKAVGTGQVALVLAIGTAGFVLPFVLLAWLAGFLADRYPKRTVIAWCKFAEILIVAAAAAAVAWGVRNGGLFLGLPAGLWLLLGTVVAIGCQAALLAPSVIGTIPESVPAGRLSNANGLFAMATLAATLFGMAGGNWLADATTVPQPGGFVDSAPAWVHAVPAGIVLVGLAAAGWLASLWLVQRPAADPLTPRPWNALSRTWGDLAELFASRELAAAAAGIVFFWALGAVAQLNVDQFATESGASSQGQIVPLLVALVGGIGLGSLIAGRVSTRGVDIGLVPVGAALMAVGSFCLAACPRPIFAACSAACGSAGTTGGFAWWFAAGSLLLVGLGAGVFDVPLEASFQERSPAPRRGALLAALNLLTFAGMFAASAVYGLLRTPSGAAGAVDPQPFLSARGIFGIFGLLAAAAAAAAVYAAPRASLRMFVSSIVNAAYRFRVERAGLMPATGPVVVVANHLSWLDGFIVVLASPRPVRMVVYGPNIKGKFMRMLADQWRFILFDPRPKSIGQALKTIQTGLADGDVIGIFCEGGISRTGQILGFKRGLEWILERVEAPIVPLHIDGMWGSLLSFSEGRFFTKWPRGWRRPLTLTFGPALPVGAHPDEARLALQEITASSVRRRMVATRDPRRDVAAWRRRFPAAGMIDPAPAAAIDWSACAATAEAFDGACIVRREDRLLASLADADPLQESLGRFGGPLLGIRAVVADPGLPARALGEMIVREGITIWLARVEQVLSLAAEPTDGGTPLPGWCATLDAVVMPLDDPARLPLAEEAAARFREAFGVEPVVAFAPRAAGGLVAMNTPPSRSVADHEITLKNGTLGRVVNGVVVWPQALMRDRLGLGSPAVDGVPAGDPRTLVIGATLAWPADRRTSDVPATRLLDDAFDVDKDGFLVPRP
jgi:acyl-[acyl-carrier-protein]-phospholipid O-acyltransferase/long-chain-fatty-acid--[acyl-carrier-protein] ligase